ncbi:hypothetical protein F5887DRAFT_958299 [Amanita rubescens]|nr:hypothetical protein F5887DRAFT_958299 [Amanita rubescens]
MTSYIEINLWGLQPLKKAQVVSASAFVASMDFEPAPDAAFRQLSRCTTVQCLFLMVNLNLYQKIFHPLTTTFNSLHYTVTEITVIKQCFLAQHEELLIGLRYQPAHPAHSIQPPIYILVNPGRNINFQSSTKLAINPIECTIAQTRPSGCNITVWHLPFRNTNFQLNLVQLATILNFVSHEASRYNLPAKNCFWFTRATRLVIAQVLDIENPDTFLVTWRRSWLWRIGACFHQCIDNVGQNQVNHITQQCEDKWQEFMKIAH